MRVRLQGRKTVVTLRHFRYCSKHIAILMQLQAETPSLELYCESPEARTQIVLVAHLELDHEDLRFLNPSAAA